MIDVKKKITNPTQHHHLLFSSPLDIGHGSYSHSPFLHNLFHMQFEGEGGWLALGWDLEDEVVGCGGDVERDSEDILVRQCGALALELWSDDGLEMSGSMTEDVNMDFGSDFSSAEPSSNETIAIYKEEATGIEGIISRLKNERSTVFGATLKEQEKSDHALTDNAWNSQGVMPFGSLSNTTVVGHDRSSDNVINDNVGTKSQDSLSKNQDGSDFIRKRLQSLELVLSNALQSLKSNSDEFAKMNEDLQEETDHLSDAWEFQQTELIRAKDKLRSLRAKLAVLEGKMSLAIIDAQKRTEAKQKKIDGARQTIQLLHTTCITWRHSASDVLLVGSFDGWTTQRRMEKSATGTHSLTLKLYSGVHEIKFIVDGVWRIDPFRPVTRNNGLENNILIVP